MIRFFANANYDFIRLRYWAYGLTAAFVVPGLLVLAVRGLNYSIEFTGGTLIQVRTTEAVGSARLRAALDKGGVPGAEIQTFGSDLDYLVRARVEGVGTEGEAATQATREAVTRALDADLGADGYTVQRTEAVSPKVGRELQGKAFLAILLSFGVTLVYLAYRFEWRFGLAAVLATAHDIVATIAFMSFLHVEISLTVIAAVLTVIGYSLNDTIIIFDRVRENLRKFRRRDLYDILNLSINQTLPRSVLTHGTTMAAVLALAILAGEVIRPFALVMLFGIFTGTFSSIYVASPVLMLIEQRWPGADARGTRAFDARAATEPAR